MNRLLTWLFTVLLAGTATAQLKISQYPNTNAPASNDLFILAVSGTNKNLSYGQLSNAIRGPLIRGASITNPTIYEGYVRSSTNVGNFQVPAGTTIAGPGFTVNPTTLNATKGAGNYLTDVDGAGTMVWTNLVNSTPAPIIYVSPWGNDASAVKGRRDKPWQTLSNAIVASSKGDTIWLMPGIHTNSGNAVWSTTYKGCATNYYKTDITFLGEANPVLYFPTGFNCVVVYRCNNLLFDGITFMNDKSTANLMAASNNVEANRFAAAITLVESTNITVRNCTFTNLFGSGVMEIDYGNLFNSTNGILVENCKFYDTGLYTATTHTVGMGAAINCCGGWTMRNNYIERCMIGIQAYGRVGATTLNRAPPWFAINNTIVDCCYCGIWSTEYNQDAIFILGNTIRRQCTEIAKTHWPSPNSNSVHNIYLNGCQNAVVAGNYLEGGVWGLRASAGPLSGSSITNLIVENNQFLWTSYMACLVEDNSDGVQINGNAFSQVGQYGVFIGKGGSPDWHLNTRVLNNNIYGYNSLLGSGEPFSYKFANLVSNLWLDGNMAYGLWLGASPPAQAGYFLHTTEGYATNVYLGNNVVANCTTNLLLATTTTPFWTGAAHLIETNAVNPPSIASNAWFVTNVTWQSLSVAAADDTVSAAVPATWYSEAATAGTCITVNAFPSNNAVFLMIYNSGPAAIDLNSATVKIDVSKPPPLWPGTR